MHAPGPRPHLAVVLHPLGHLARAVRAVECTGGTGAAGSGRGRQQACGLWQVAHDGVGRLVRIALVVAQRLSLIKCLIADGLLQ